MAEFSEEMADYIRGWGIPKILEDVKDDLVFKFDDDGISTTIGMGYQCSEESVKFCLYNTKLKKVLFSMDFQQKNDRCAFNGPVPRIKLYLIYTHIDTFRRKGIASYYISKLREYAINQNVKCISLTANADGDNLKNDKNNNALKQKELEMFYEKRNTDDMPIIF